MKERVSDKWQIFLVDRATIASMVEVGVMRRGLSDLDRRLVISRSPLVRRSTSAVRLLMSPSS